MAQLVAIPFMTDGAGVDLIGGWFGSGCERGLALIFTVADLIGLVATVVARSSGWYRSMSNATVEDDGPAELAST